VYIVIVEPIARSLWALELLYANAADVFMFWLAIAASLRELFSKNEYDSGISSVLAGKVTAIVNRRYKAFIDEGPNSGLGSDHEIFFTAFFLHPRKLFYC
jgi:hypothetical protein